LAYPVKSIQKLKISLKIQIRDMVTNKDGNIILKIFVKLYKLK